MLPNRERRRLRARFFALLGGRTGREGPSKSLGVAIRVALLVVLPWVARRSASDERTGRWVVDCPRVILVVGPRSAW
jgi:hypothetical protein